jgi:hypothetical protein
MEKESLCGADDKWENSAGESSHSWEADALNVEMG